MAGRVLIGIFLLLLSSGIATAQVKVVVLDEQDKEPIPHVSVIVKNTAGSSIQFTNARGVSKIDTTMLSTELVHFSHLDYKDRVVLLSDLERMNFKVYLTPNVEQLPPYIHKPKRDEVAQEIIVSSKKVDPRALKMDVPQTSADALQSAGSVFIQKTQMGGGSPMIRGFSANRVLLVVDGVRMNNAIYRDGNVHNVISIDPHMLREVEVYEGPGSVIFGSDALGGVMHFETTELETAPVGARNTFHSGNTIVELHSANRGNSWHVDFEAKKERFASLTGVTLSNFSSLRSGSRGNNVFEKNFYVEHIDGQDTMVKNENPLVQEFSGYSQFNFSQKFLFERDTDLIVKAGFFFATTSPVPRYDRLSQFSGQTLQYSEWNYGPQKWLMSYVNASFRNENKAYDELSLLASFQGVEESRMTRNFGDSIGTKRTENVQVFALNLDADKALSNKTTLYYGAEFLYNLVGSAGETFNIKTFENQSINDTRYPDGSTWMASALYSTLSKRFSDKWRAQAGVRFNHVLVNAPAREGLSVTFNEIDQSFLGVNGSLGTTFMPDDRTEISANIGTGFRAPNIDDMGKIFDSQPGRITVPNDNLKPENVYSIDLLYTRKPNHRSRFGVGVFYSLWDGVIQRRDFLVNGQDSVVYDGQLMAVQALINGEAANLYGAQIFGTYRFSNAFKVEGNFNYQTGQTSDGQAIRHIAPAFGNVHFIYIANKIKIDLYTRFNGALQFEDLAPSEQDKTQLYALDDNGNPYSPAWATLNIKSIYTISSKLNFSFGIENVLDTHYRPYSSGISAPGINAIFSLRSRF